MSVCAAWYNSMSTVWVQYGVIIEWKILLLYKCETLCECYKWKIGVHNENGQGTMSTHKLYKSAKMRNGA